jgi:DNA polymerase III subunit delta
MSILKYQDFKTKLKTLKKSEVSPVYLFYGYDEYLKDEIISQIEKLLIDPSTKDLNYSVFHFGDKESASLSVENILESANSYPFISERRLVIVKNANKISESQDNLFENYIDKPAKTTCLILVCGDKLPKREVFKKIEELFPTINFYHLFESGICQWIIEEAKSFGKKISYMAAQRVCDITGDNMADIKQEIDKLILFIGDKPEIIVEDVEKCCGHFKEDTVFELLPVLAKKEINSAFKILINLFNNGEIGCEFAVISTISDRYRKYIKFFEAIAMGSNELDAASMAGVYGFFQKDFLKDVRNVERNDIKTNLQKILDTELKMKSGGNSKLQVEKLFFELCNPPGKA